MTDRVVSLTVILEKDFRVDDVEVLKNVISMIRGVGSVHDGPVVEMSDYVNRELIAADFRKRLFAVLDPEVWAKIKGAGL